MFKFVNFSKSILVVTSYLKSHTGLECLTFLQIDRYPYQVSVNSPLTGRVQSPLCSDSLMTIFTAQGDCLVTWAVILNKDMNSLYEGKALFIWY